MTTLQPEVLQEALRYVEDPRLRMLCNMVHDKHTPYFVNRAYTSRSKTNNKLGYQILHELSRSVDLLRNACNAKKSISWELLYTMCIVIPPGMDEYYRPDKPGFEVMDMWNYLSTYDMFVRRDYMNWRDSWEVHLNDMMKLCGIGPLQRNTIIQGLLVTQDWKGVTSQEALVFGTLYKIVMG